MVVHDAVRALLSFLLLLHTWPLTLQTQGQDQAELVSGDVMLAAMMGVNSLDGEGCGRYDVNVLKRLMAVTWFLEALNGVDYFGGGVRLGLTAYRTCQNQGRAMTHAVEILNQFNVLKPKSGQSANSTVPLLGLVGPDRTEEAKAVSLFFSSLPPSWRPLEISASATGEALTDKALYSNLFRVIPPDSTQVEVLVKLLKALHWNYIAIIYDDHDYGRLASDRLHRLAAAQDICVTYHSKVPLDSRRLEFSQEVNSIADVIQDKLIKGLVFIGNRATAKEFLIQMEQRVLFPRFIFSEAVGLQDSEFEHVGKVLALSKGAFVLTPPTRPLPEFKRYWNDVWTNRTLFLRAADTNPWLGGYFSQLTPDCTAHDDLCWSSSQDRRPVLDNNTRWLFEYYNVKAVAVFAALLKTLMASHCRESPQPAQGLCPALTEVLRNDRQTVQRLLHTSSFHLEAEFGNVTSAFHDFPPLRFDGDGEIVELRSAESVYDVFNFQRCQDEQFCFMKVGSLTGDNNFTLNVSAVRGYGEIGEEKTTPDLPRAQCSERSICTECLPSDIPNEIILVPGDFYIVAVATAHDRDRQDVLGCGSIMTAFGADLIQGMLYSLQQVNAQGVFSKDKKLGVIVLNSCFRELVIKRKLMDLHSGTLQLPDGRNSSAILPYIAGYVGAFYSTISVAAYEVLSKMTEQFVLLSPTNTSPNLSDRHKYPNYLRLTTKSNDQAMAMLGIVQRLKSSYVQVIYDPEDDYSSGLKDAINQLSHSPPYNICVIHNINASYDDDSLGRVYDRLCQYSWAPVVIVLLQYEHVRNFTNVVTTVLKPNQFVFIGSETWEKKQELLDPVNGVEKRLEGSFVLYQGLPVDRQFDAYFKKLDPFSSTNPWLRYFWEAAENCYFEDSFQKKGRAPCPVNRTSGDISAMTENYVQSVWVPLYINAVKVFAEGLREAMMERCQILTLCKKLRAEDLIRKLKGVRMDMAGTRQEQLVFDANGDGTLGYDVYQVQRQHGKLLYVKVGSYLNGHGSLTISAPVPTSGQCLTQEQCQGCFPPTPSHNTCGGVENVTREPLSGHEPDSTAFIAVLSVLIVVVVIICVIVIVAVCHFHRRKTQSHTSTSLRGLQNTEMTPVPESGDRGFRRLHSSPSITSSLFATCGGSGAWALAKEDPTYLEINQCSRVPEVVIRGKENAVFWSPRATPPLPPPPPACGPSTDVSHGTYLRPCLHEDANAAANVTATLHEDYFPRYGSTYGYGDQVNDPDSTESLGTDISAAPDIVFANELSGSSGYSAKI